MGAPGTVLPWAGRRSRRSEVPEFFRVLESACVPAETQVEVEAVLIDGEDAVVFGTYHRMFRAKNGRSFATPEAVHIRVVDGRIIRWHLYGDTGASKMHGSTAEQGIQRTRQAGDAHRRREMHAHRPVHWAWVVAAVSFIAILGAAGFRSVPPSAAAGRRVRDQRCRGHGAVRVRRAAPGARADR